MSQPNDPDRPDQTPSAPGGGQEQPPAPEQGQQPQYGGGQQPSPAPQPGQQPPQYGGGQQPPPAPQGQQPQPGQQPPQYPGGGGQQPPPPPGQYPQYPGGGGQQPPPQPGQYAQYPPGAGAPAQGYQYAPPPGFYYDAESELELPDGTALASPGRRLGGYFLETLLVIVTLFIGWLIWSLIVWSKGLTPAKQLLGMRCYRKNDRRPASWGWMAMRQFVGGFVEGIIPLGIIISGVMLLVSKQRMMIHDHLAGTVVLYDPEKRLEAYFQQQ